MNAPPGFRGMFASDLNTRSAYSEGAGPYRIVPAGVAVPRDLDDVIALVRWAGRERRPLIPRGAGSGMPGGNVGQGVVADLREFRRPLAVSGDHTANAGCAVTCAALNRAAAAYGLRLAPNPSSGAFCTLGGMVATNAAGARSVRSGSIRNWVRGVEMVTADGEVGWFGRSLMQRKGRVAMPGSHARLGSFTEASRRFEAEAKAAVLTARSLIESRFPRTRKNSSGYALDRFLASGDTLDLIIGSEGTLGIVTRVDLLLEPRPAGAATALLGLDDLAALPGIIRTLMPHDPAAVELLDRTFLALAGPRLQFAGDGLEAVLIIEFERSTAAAAQSAMEAAVRDTGSRAVPVLAGVSDEERAAIWSVRHAASPALAALPATRRSLQIIEDACVPVPVLDRYLAGVRGAAERHGVEIVAFGHAGDGHLHVNALADTSLPDMERRLSGLLHDATGLVAQLGGTLSGEHGDGRLRAPMLEQVYGAEITALFRQVKQAFDPQGIMNPGVIVPDEETNPVAHLKVGAGAEPIPPEIERRLREVERTAAWNLPRNELAEAGAHTA